MAPNATALTLEVDPKKPPMRINSFTRVDRLNADLLDGRESNQFITITDKASDSDELDGKDSTAFANGTDGKAEDAAIKGAWGAYERGRHQVGARNEWATSRLEENGARVAFEYLSSVESWDLSLVHRGTLVSGAEAKLSPASTDPNDQPMPPSTLRVKLELFRNGRGRDGSCRIVLPSLSWSRTISVTVPAPPESMMRQGRATP